MVNKKTGSSIVNNEVEVFSCVVLQDYAEGSEVNVRCLHHSLITFVFEVEVTLWKFK